LFDKETSYVTGARYEIAVDGKPLIYRDLEVAFYSARHHKMLHPNERVTVRDLITGETIAITKPMAVKWRKLGEVSNGVAHVRQNIFAYTSPGGLSPEYISIKSNSDGGAEITVRSLGGGLASIDLPPDELVTLGRALLARQPVSARWIRKPRGSEMTTRYLERRGGQYVACMVMITGDALPWYLVLPRWRELLGLTE
jgi:hypothetical protein